MLIAEMTAGASDAGVLACVAATVAEVVAIVSNHEEAASVARLEGIPYHYWPVTKQNKAEQEQRLLDDTLSPWRGRCPEVAGGRRLTRSRVRPALSRAPVSFVVRQAV